MQKHPACHQASVPHMFCSIQEVDPVFEPINHKSQNYHPISAIPHFMVLAPEGCPQSTKGPSAESEIRPLHQGEIVGKHSDEVELP